MKALIGKLLHGAYSEDAAVKNEALTERILSKLDQRIAKRDAERQIRNMGRLVRVNGHK